MRWVDGRRVVVVDGRDANGHVYDRWFRAWRRQAPWRQEGDATNQVVWKGGAFKAHVGAALRAKPATHRAIDMAVGRAAAATVAVVAARVTGAGKVRDEHHVAGVAQRRALRIARV